MIGVHNQHRGAKKVRHGRIQSMNLSRMEWQMEISKGGKYHVVTETKKHRGRCREKISQELEMGAALHTALASGLPDSAGIPANHVTVLFVYGFLHIIGGKMGWI